MTQIARVALDQPLPHLDRFFDYLVPADFSDTAVVGARVKVRFAGRRLDGWIVELTDSSAQTKLAALERVISSEPLMRPELVKLIRAVADHYAGTFSDVMRLAIPPRHARTEQATQQTWPHPKLDLNALVLPNYPQGSSFLRALAAGKSPRGFWQVIPTPTLPGDWATGFAEACAQVLAENKSVLILVPDEKDLSHAQRVFSDCFGRGSVAILHADLGLSRRYRNYLAATRGAATILIGTRAAAFTPLPNLGLICLWDDGNDLYAEPRCPYPHTREIVAIRVAQQGLALLIAAYGRTAEVQRFCDLDWLKPIEVTPGQARAISATVRVAADSNFELARDTMARQVRLPSRAFQVLRIGLTQGPVLIQSPRSGYAVALSCDRCRTQVRCAYCAGPLKANELGVVQCAWCTRLIPEWVCANCGSHRLRAPKIGATRIAEELSRAFKGITVLESSAGESKIELPDEPVIVVATPGAEPVAPSGYAAGLLLDADLTLSRADLRVNEESLRRWFNFVALVRPAAAGGTVLIMGDPAARTIQALVRIDPSGAAQIELADRVQGGFSPAVKVVRIQGSYIGLTEFLAAADFSFAERIGPAEESNDHWTLVLRSNLSHGKQLVANTKLAMAHRSARKRVGMLRVQVDPQEMG